LIIVENLPVPVDRRVRMVATTLREVGYEVSIICPAGKGFEKKREVINDIHVYRHPLPTKASDTLEYVLVYSMALFWKFVMTLRVLRVPGFDVIHACNIRQIRFSDRASLQALR